MRKVVFKKNEAIRLSLQSPIHSFKKRNNMTQSDSGGSYDLYECEHCRISGKRRGLAEYILVAPSPKIHQCNGRGIVSVAPNKRVEVVRCMAHGLQFENMTPRSIHTIIDPPEGEKPNGINGVWVMGVGEPIKLLFDEYIDYVSRKLVRTKF